MMKRLSERAVGYCFTAHLLPFNIYNLQSNQKVRVADHKKNVHETVAHGIESKKSPGENEMQKQQIDCRFFCQMTIVGLQCVWLCHWAQILKAIISNETGRMKEGVHFRFCALMIKFPFDDCVIFFFFNFGEFLCANAKSS